jgi:hypothetical protein
MSAPATAVEFDKLDLETAIIHITATIHTLDVIIDYATERNVDHLRAEGCLISTGRHLMADLEALREAFYGKNYADVVEGGAA